MSLAICF